MSKILLIEDTESLGEIICEILTLEGFEVTWARDGQEGLELFSKVKPDLVITDLVMPRLNGLEVIGRIRVSHAAETFPVIILSARTSPEDLDAGYKAGANVYLKKPCQSKVLIDTIRELLATPESSSPPKTEPATNK